MNLNQSEKEFLSSLNGRLDEFDRPAFLYDLDFLKEHLKEGIEQAKSREIRFLYACKANSASPVLETLNALGADFDVASRGELDQVLKVGACPTSLICTGPAKSRQYLKDLLEVGVGCFVLESEQQLVDLQSLAVERSRKIQAILRIQLAWNEGGASVLGGSEPTVFGLIPSDWESILKSKDHSKLDILGVHCFQWGNILSLNKLEETWKDVAREAREFCHRAQIEPQVLDMGGGMGLDYETSDFTEYTWGEAFEILERVRNESGFEKIWIEPGRFSVGLSGSYFTRVIDRKTSRGKNFLILESGMNHLLRPALTKESFPVGLAFREGENSRLEFELHGPLCTALDWVGRQELPEDIRPGDWLRFSKVGAYGFTESMPLFLCHDWPAELIWTKGELQVLRSSLPAREWMK